MILEIKIPSPGESITEVEIGKWLVSDGALVTKDQEIAEIESDKATLSITAPATGTLKILLKEGERVAVGSIACQLDSTGTIEPTENETILLSKNGADNIEVPKGAAIGKSESFLSESRDGS
jgi:2-oxoglutarate dehydrogenase E2 component (dihydrolipoamide succinyltransferase)